MSAWWTPAPPDPLRPYHVPPVNPLVRPGTGQQVARPMRAPAPVVAVRVDPSAPAHVADANHALAVAIETFPPPRVPRPVASGGDLPTSRKTLRRWAEDILVELPAGTRLRVVSVGGHYWELYVEEES